MRYTEREIKQKGWEQRDPQISWVSSWPPVRKKIKIQIKRPYFLTRLVYWFVQDISSFHPVLVVWFERAFGAQSLCSHSRSRKNKGRGVGSLLFLRTNQGNHTYCLRLHCFMPLADHTYCLHFCYLYIISQNVVTWPQLIPFIQKWNLSPPLNLGWPCDLFWLTERSWHVITWFLRHRLNMP